MGTHLVTMSQGQGSLLRYDNPVLVSRNDEKKSPASKKFTANHQNEQKNQTDSQKQTDEILNSILPPQQWEADGGLWVQRVRERQARETGICPVRRELYQQGFDELI